MKRNIFGTDGIRGMVGAEPFLINSLVNIGSAIADWAQEKYGKNPHILLAHDTRISSSFVKSALKSGLLLSPVNIYDGHVLPSPAVSQIINLDNIFNCGIIISASHNPYDDNGIKIVDSKQGKLSPGDEELITSLINDTKRLNDYTNLGVEHRTKDFAQDYEQALENVFKPNMMIGKKVILDCAHGATYKIAPSIFKKLGAHCIVLNNNPNGTNINDQCGTLYPAKLQRAVIDHNADIGFAFDGDGDRIVCVNKEGAIKDGDDILALLIHHPDYKATKNIIGTIMTNQGLDVYLKRHNKDLERTPVGDKYIAEYLTTHNLLLGGEPSGHIILNNYLPTGDGIFTALKIIETLLLTDNWDMKTFIKFPQIIINIPVKHKKDLTTPPLSDVIAASSRKLTTGRLIVRYSGTEHLLRIMIEDDDIKHAESIGSLLSEQLLQEIS